MEQEININVYIENSLPQAGGVVKLWPGVRER